MSNEETAMIPIADALPELRAEQYAKVREWDAARMALEGEYEAADGEYLSKIRAALKEKHGLWIAYLRARDIPRSTADDRIRKAEGRFITPKRPVTGHLPAPVSPPASQPPAEDTVIVPRDELARLEHIETWAQKAGYYGKDTEYGNWPLMDVGLPSDHKEPAPPESPTAMPIPAQGLEPFRAFVEGVSETLEARSLPMDSFIKKLETLPTVTEDALACWLELASAEDCERISETLDRVCEWAAHVKRTIAQHQHKGLRIIR